MAFESAVLFSISEIMMINAEIIKKLIPILSRKGISGVKYFIAAESGIDAKTAINAAFAEVRFQNKPNRKIATTPGLIKPVYS